MGDHPSEPNYIWAEAGTTFGIANDDDPCTDNPTNEQSTHQHLTAFLMEKHLSWKSYQEDTDIDYSDNAVLPTWDESEGGDDPSRTLPFIVISKDAHPNVGGLPYAATTEYSHSSTLRTMQEVFDVDPDHGFPFLGDAINANDLTAMFKPGVVRR